MVEDTKSEEKEIPEADESVVERDLIKEANETAERLEAANKEHAKLLEKQEKLAIEAKLGGKAEAGMPSKEEEKAAARVKEIMGSVGKEG